ncbi:MAG: hypothetical protein JWM60_2768 [Solirubrobacterales bacterium]|nr:hypothetical protein [Solirubrobacterales bacterium]
MSERRERRLWARLERRPLLMGAAAAVIALGAASAMAAFAGFAATADVLTRIAPGWLAAAVGARLVAYLGYALAHHRVMSACEESGIEPDTAARVVAFGAGATSLKGGFSIDARALRGSGASRRAARAHVAALAMFEYAVLASGAWVGSLLLIGAGHVQSAVIWPWIVGVPAGVAVASSAYVALSRRPVRGRWARPVKSLLLGGAILAGQSRRPLRALAATAGMLLYWCAEIGALWAALRAFGITCSPLVAIVGFATGYVLTPRGLPLAGAGVAEVLVPLGLSWLGIALPAAIVGAFAAEVTRLVVSIPFALLTREDVQELVEAV